MPTLRRNEAENPNEREGVRRVSGGAHDTRRTPLCAAGKSSRLALLAAAALLSSALTAAETPVPVIDIGEIRVEGVSALPALEVEKIIYPHLGPSRTADDVELARAALEKAYQDKGYKTVSVIIPAQQVQGGVVVLRVVEGKVGRLRVRGAKYNEPDAIKAGAPSLAEGKVPDFDAVQKDLVALQSADRQVTPVMKPGVEPGTVDVDLEVKDEFPLQGSLELNNRYNRNTNPLRLNGAIHYDNLWQAGHSIGFSFQSEVNPRTGTSTPLNRDSRHQAGTGKIIPDDTQVYSAHYIVPKVGADWLSLMVSGTKQSSLNVGSGINVLGDGVIAGMRLIASPAPKGTYFQSISAGFDYKRFDNDLTINQVAVDTPPITYFPFTTDYNGTKLWADGSTTQGVFGVTWHLRGLGDDETQFEANRAGASGGFIHFRTDFSHTQKLPEDFELFGRVQSQISPQPLVPNEQFGVGGLNTVRGYLESEALGDLGVAGSAELRTPSFTLGGTLDEWRLYTFADWAGALVNEAAAGQRSRYELASVGAGTRMKFAEHFSGSIDVGVPLIKGPYTDKQEARVTFTLKAEF